MFLTEAIVKGGDELDYIILNGVSYIIIEFTPLHNSVNKISYGFTH